MRAQAVTKAAMAKQAHNARESWLRAVVDGFFRPWFSEHNYTIPQNLLVSVGWPPNSRIKRSGKSSVRGVCCPSSWNDGKAVIIYITPQMGSMDEYLSVLAHELVHATVGLGAKHGPAFKKAGEAIGLEGKPTAMEAGEDLGKRIRRWVRGAKLGKFPHHAERFKDARQGTRMLKVRCTQRGCPSRNFTGNGTGYTLRVTRTWLASFGAPYCPACEEEMVEA